MTSCSVCDDGANGELPLEADPDVEQDCSERGSDAERRHHRQFARDGGADDLDAAEIIIRLELAAHQRRCRLLGILSAALGGDADPRIRRAAGAFDPDLTEIEIV